MKEKIWYYKGLFCKIEESKYYHVFDIGFITKEKSTILFGRDDEITQEEVNKMIDSHLNAQGIVITNDCPHIMEAVKNNRCVFSEHCGCNEDCLFGVKQ